MLKDAEIPGSFYIITNEANNADPNNINDEESYIDYARLQEIAAAGNEVTAHTRTHASLVGLTSNQILAEVQGSRQDLLGKGFSPVSTFAYTFGEYNAAITQAVQTAGFSGARTTDDGYNIPSSNKLLLSTQNVERTTTPQQMIQWINTAVANKSWVILTFHQVYAGTDQYSTTPERLQEVVNYLQQNNIAVITMHEGVQKMQ